MKLLLQTLKELENKHLYTGNLALTILILDALAIILAIALPKFLQ